MIVTLSREYGAAALAVARGLGERLGYRVVNNDLPVVVATRLGISEETAAQIDAGPPPLVERMVYDLAMATPQTHLLTVPIEAIDAPYVREVERAVREFADRGDCVIVGRSAGAVLGRRSDVLRVFLTAPIEWRVAHLREALQFDERTAKSEIQRIDSAREAYVARWYQSAWRDLRKYDLVVDTSRVGVDGAIGVIADVVTSLVAAR